MNKISSINNLILKNQLIFNNNLISNKKIEQIYKQVNYCYDLIGKNIDIIV